MGSSHRGRRTTVVAAPSGLATAPARARVAGPGAPARARVAGPDAPARARIAGLAAVMAIGLAAGCSNPARQTFTPTEGEPTTSASSSASAPTSPTTDNRPAAPLTGLHVDPAVVKQGAVAVAVAGSDPVGLDHADLVLEEISSPVRWLAVFQSRDADEVGPVTATRPVDGMALSVLKPAFAFRGGSTGSVNQVEASQVLPVNSARRSDLFADRGGNLFAATAALRSSTKPPAAQPLLVFGASDAPAPSGGRAAHQATVALPGAASQTWSYDAKARLWRRTDGGPDVSVANLVIQVVEYKQFTVNRRQGTTVPSARIFGTGVSTVLTGTAAITGRWSKRGVASVTNYADGAGVPVRMAPGSTWVILAPTGSTVRTA